MSLSLAQAVHQDHPELRYQFMICLLQTLRARGHSAYLVCKTAGEDGQYTPPGFAPRALTGFDGKAYTCTGVSPDAIWCDGVQFTPISPQGVPQWTPIPKACWRHQNPPLLEELP